VPAKFASGIEEGENRRTVARVVFRQIGRSCPTASQGDAIDTRFGGVVTGSAGSLCAMPLWQSMHVRSPEASIVECCAAARGLWRVKSM
jgi:hypothetical protein